MGKATDTFVRLKFSVASKLAVLSKPNAASRESTINTSFRFHGEFYAE